MMTENTTDERLLVAYLAGREHERRKHDREASELTTWNPAVVRADLLAEVRAALAEMTAHRDATQIEYDEMRADRDGCRTALAAVGRQRDEARDRADRLRAELDHWQTVIVPELKAERDGLRMAAVAAHDNTAALQAEVDRMRPVVEAAETWRTERATGAGGAFHAACRALASAVDAYRSDD